MKKRIGFKEALELVIEEAKNKQGLINLYKTLIDKPINKGSNNEAKEKWEYVLNLLCYAYYVKSDNLISDFDFDMLEKQYAKKFNEDIAPMRGMEGRLDYKYGIKFIYDELKKRCERMTSHQIYKN